MKQNIKEELVKLITDKMQESGRLPWSSGLLNKARTPVNGKTMKTYNGINFLILAYLSEGSSQEFLTFHQVIELGGRVKKGSKALPVVYWSKWNKKEHRTAQKGDEEQDCYFFLKKYSVFEIGAQTEGINPRRTIKEKENPPLSEAEDFIKTFIEATGIKFTQNPSISLKNRTAYYDPMHHAVQVAPRSEFDSSEAYVATCFHELVHSTGKAMKRQKVSSFGKEDYSKEEIVAEFGAALLCRHFGITSQENNTAAYIQSWSKALQDNPDWLIQGANAAQKAVDYMMETVEAAEMKRLLA